MTTKVRKQIYLEPRQDAILKELARTTGISEAEIIRQAIDRHTQSFQLSKPDLIAWEEEQSFINHLIEQGSVPGGRSWQRSDLYER